MDVGVEYGLACIEAVVDADIETRDGRVILLDGFFQSVQKYVCIGFFFVRQTEIIRCMPLGDNEQVAICDWIFVPENDAGVVLGYRFGVGDELAENATVMRSVVVRQNGILPVRCRG